MPLVYGAKTGLFWMCEVILCTLNVIWFIFLLFVLWVYGIVSVFMWCSWRIKPRDDNDGRSRDNDGRDTGDDGWDRVMVIPGEEMWEDQCIWNFAKSLVRNNYYSKEDAREKFHVGIFAKMTSGLEVKDLGSQTQTNHETTLKTIQETLIKCMGTKGRRRHSVISFQVSKQPSRNPFFSFLVLTSQCRRGQQLARNVAALFVTLRWFTINMLVRVFRFCPSPLREACCKEKWTKQCLRMSTWVSLRASWSDTVVYLRVLGSSRITNVVTF